MRNKGQKTAVLLTMMLSVSMIPNNLKAEPRTCSDVLKMCDTALQDQRGLNHEQQKLIQIQDDQLVLQRNKIIELENDKPSIIESPYLWLAVGFVGGVLLVK